jgi:hypothetical protein
MRDQHDHSLVGNPARGTRPSACAGAGSGALRRERDPLHSKAPGGFAQAVAAVAELERVTQGSPETRGVVLLYGFFYGPGTSSARGGSIAAEVRRRRFLVVGDGSGVFSFAGLCLRGGMTHRRNGG